MTAPPTENASITFVSGDSKMLPGTNKATPYRRCTSHPAPAAGQPTIQTQFKPNFYLVTQESYKYPYAGLQEACLSHTSQSCFIDVNICLYVLYEWI